jgi:hypothetical protein
MKYYLNKSVNSKIKFNNYFLIKIDIITGIFFIINKISNGIKFL